MEAEDEVGRRWEQIRRRWLSPKLASNVDMTSESPDAEQDGARLESSSVAPRPRRKRDTAVAAKLQALERLLRTGSPSGDDDQQASGAGSPKDVGREPKALVPHSDEHTAVVNSQAIPNPTAFHNPQLSYSSSGGKAAQSHKARQPSLDELEDNIDGGGLVIRERQRDELKRASESILLAFKQARPLKEPLPLSLVVSLLYRSWELDGTIPKGYVSPPNGPNAIASRNVPFAAPVATRPSTVVGSEALNPALPPRSLESTPTPGGGTPVPPPDVATIPPSPPPPAEPIDLPEPVAQLQGLGGTGENGKMKIDMLRGSRWRTEKEILSGSDVI
ncbi:Nucleolar GTP-binding protein 1 [Microbotryomycetes sp. JL201]|nr:Nucleolar GTP-binding protein 1 [Microbotryomycetes sp. JL201]